MSTTSDYFYRADNRVKACYFIEYTANDENVTARVIEDCRIL